MSDVDSSDELEDEGPNIGVSIARKPKDFDAITAHARPMRGNAMKKASGMEKE